MIAAYHTIITKGLNGGPACHGLITSKFSLFCRVLPPVPPPVSGGGGPYPGRAWNKVPDINNFYKPVQHTEPQQYYQQSGKVVVSITVAYGEQSVEKIYLVTPKQKDVIIKVLSMLNTTVTKFRVGISSITKKVRFVFNKILNIQRSNSK